MSKEIRRIYRPETEGIKDIKYTLRLSSRAKYKRIVQKATGELIVVIPHFVRNPAWEAETMLRENEETILGWIEKDQLRKKAGDVPVTRSGLLFDIHPGRKVHVCGEPFEVCFEENPRYQTPKLDLDRDNQKIVFAGRDKDQIMNAAAELWTGFLLRSVKEKTDAYLGSDKILNFFRLHHTWPKSITVRFMTSRWGSCTNGRRTVRLNALLAQLPEKYLYYVIDHEFSHLVVPAHNSDFYKVLSDLNPESSQIQQEMKRMVIQEDGSIFVRSV